MNNLILELIQKYKPKTTNDYKNALHEIIQELALVGLWRSKFFEIGAFYGGTSLRILYGLDRFSEDLDFSLLKPNPLFNLHPYLTAIQHELIISGLSTHVEQKIKHPKETIHSAFLKTNTLETLIHIGLSAKERKTIQTNQVMKIKIEVDIDPPAGFSTETKVLLTPLPFSVKTYAPEDLFAGKIHAILFRPYKVRVKGRDWYDLVWYAARKTPIHLKHLEARMKQSGHWNRQDHLTPRILVELLKEKANHLNIQAARTDILPFIQDPRSIEIWSQDFFLHLIDQLEFS